MSKEETTQHTEDFLLPDYEDVTLPSGLKARLWPPNDLEFYARCGALPGALAAAARGESDQKGDADSDRMLQLSWRMICVLFIQPRFTLAPALCPQCHSNPHGPACGQSGIMALAGPGELHPRRLRAKDRKWVDRWAATYLDVEGIEALEGFRPRSSGAAPAAGPSGGNVQLPSQQPAEGDTKGVGN